MRYDDQSGDSGDLEEAISLGREALLLCAPGHPERSAVLNNLSGSLKKQYNRSRDFKDLEEALALEKEALSLCLHGHGNRSYCPEQPCALTGATISGIPGPQAPRRSSIAGEGSPLSLPCWSPHSITAFEQPCCNAGDKRAGSTRPSE